jgi:hypothetical protein
MDRFRNPFEGFCTRFGQKQFGTAFLNDKRNPRAGPFAPKCGTLPVAFALEWIQKGLKFQIEQGVKAKAFWNQSM